MTELVRLNIDAGGVAHLTLNHPPVNALSDQVRADLAAAFDKAEADDSVRAILLLAEGRTFPSGAELNELDHPIKDPSLSALCNQIELCSKPVIAAIQGAALGGGFELALAAHYRIASANAHVGLPEISLGLVPSAGGTQRLPRLAGAAVALEMMFVGKPVSAPEAQRLGLIDRTTKGDLAPAARAYAMELIESGAGPKRARDCRDGMADPAAFQEMIGKYRDKAHKNPVKTASRIVDCVEAAQLLPFEAGLNCEKSALEDCLKSGASRALRYVFQAERFAARVPEADGAQPRRVSRVATFGAGPDAAGWIVALLDAGFHVSLHARDEPSRTGVAEQVIAIYDQAVDRKKMQVEQEAERLGRLSDRADDTALSQADLVLVVGMSNVPTVEPICKPGAIMAISVPPGEGINFELLERPADAIGVQAPVSAHMGRLVELLGGQETAPDVLQTTAQLTRRLNRVAVLSRGEEGGLGAAVWGACVWAAEAMADMGADRATIDNALSEFGFQKLPFGGKEIRGHARTHFTADEICQRCLAAMANAGALLVQAGIARRPSDIDVVMIHGYGFPRWEGGPMMHADLTGLLTVKRTLTVLMEEDADFWAPSNLFDELIKNGKTFAAISRE
ncbi:enoyl-CoA hydratase-related protein [Actibacterium lipolyticum]|uniref:Putative enoyl-CoA hydratase n=1 Tax=Actibacterium lipolyticum TaxID=1524263 RepID=A0A238KJL5_9RHOB|nr:enoyl-CoA hydratase-related protein [Actibacterium lipolyticum]SMX42983.1 putative enoyl-CoA hydratase [Actibacterium lipolyticum]